MVFACRIAGVEAGSLAHRNKRVICTYCANSYAGKQYSVEEEVEAGDFTRCSAAALKALEHDKDCGGPKVCDF